MRRGMVALAGATIMLTSASAWAVAGETGHRTGDGAQARHPWPAQVATAVLRDADGDRVGKVWMRQRGRSVSVWASLHGLPPGFHGFHVHSVGKCEPDAPGGVFMSAEGHFNPSGKDHGEHAGDLPSLYVTDGGWARLGFVTDAFTLADLDDDNGAAVMVHGKRDNFANIPEDRYVSLEGPVPDSMTRGSGDAGSRLACGVLR